MSPYALQTKTMLPNVSDPTHQILGLPTKHEPESKAQLPTKLKRESICGLRSFNRAFTIKPCPESPYDKPSTFRPVRIIGRSQLPLTLLDTCPDDHFAPNRLFSARIDVLESYHEAQEKGDISPKVLIACYETNKTLYAIERVQQHVFSLCKLTNWLKEKDVASLWDPSSLKFYPTLHKPEITHMEDMKWWQQAVVQTEDVKKPTKRARISMLRPKPEPVEPTLMQVPGERTVQVLAPVDNVVSETSNAVLEIPLEAPSPLKLVENMVQQYLDAIYMSKTSLAYFAKGPITRLRAAFTSPDEGAPPTSELVTFFRSMLLSHKASDKKYREKLPEIVKSMPHGMFSDDEPAENAAKPRKSKKKMKLSRDGMYPQEEELVKKWWMSELRNSEVFGEETIEQRLKRRIGDLRVRETLAQMILMLEIIALEALSTYKEPVNETLEPTNETQAESQNKPKKRKRKLDDVKLQLDLLLDKLCIWQSVDQEGILDFDVKISKDGGSNDVSGKGENSDRLQSFCVEVIIPFYVSRLPEQGRMINKKLGGPVHASPPKRKAAKPPTTSRKSGEPKEPDVKKTRRSLGRVATDTVGQASNRKPTPSLHRSATDSALLNNIKREGSEVPLSAIPFQRSPSQAARHSLSQLKHLKGRQIDLSAPSAAAAAKLQQKKRVEEDLQEAISALKKPNRGLAVGSYVDDIEKRGVGSTKKSRKPTTTVRKMVQDVQVTATPRAVRRTKDMVEQTPSRHRNPFVRELEMEAPPLSDFCIPSSAVRPIPSLVPGSVQHRATARSLAGPSIAETPTKAPKDKVFLSSGPVRRAIFATPVKGKVYSPPPDKVNSPPTAVFATPCKASPTAPLAAATSSPPIVTKTPRKESTRAVVESPLPKLSKATTNKQKDVSIYDALGWNDDDDFY
ncbi:DNA replication regulator SLD3-domain-containing protein [Dendryphion nanum]|uniref:DNA replication regulator SLD3-domain-containing protein n=1 Tax=Dendryphion nanum TaxID=256645 RepID=A0A9P9E4S2_9PLEO|nr:DNA replication regulator SLD3-domain-containing protein [Dendryphion nanum]